MTNRRKHNAQAAVIHKRGKSATAGGRAALSSLRLMPRNVASAAGQGVSNIKPNLLRYVDLHPALTILTAAAIIALICVFYLSQVTAVTTANYDLQRLQSEHTKLQRIHDDLQLQIGRAQSQTTIEAKARNELKMVPLDNHYTYLTLKPGPLTSLPATANAGP